MFNISTIIIFLHLQLHFSTFLCSNSNYLFLVSCYFVPNEYDEPVLKENAVTQCTLFSFSSSQNDDNKCC